MNKDTLHPGVRLSRKGFLDLLVLGSALVLAACSPTARRSLIPPNPEQQGNHDGGPSFPFFLAMTGIKKPESLYALEQLKRLLQNPDQADRVMAIFIGNQLSVADGNVITESAIAEGRAIGGSFCSDSRIQLFAKFKAMVLGESTELWLTEARQAGAQPSIFRQGVTRSLFVSHEATPGCNFGCGYLGGVEEILLDVEKGAQKLFDHGVPQVTIDHIMDWKNKYASSIQFDKLTPGGWAQIGGRVQAYLNFVIKGEKHLVLYGVQAHGTNHLEPLGYADEAGKLYTLAEGEALSIAGKLPGAAELSGAANFLNQPHPAIESLVAGQQPNINIFSVSKHSPQAMFGDEIIQPGRAFVVNHPAITVSADALDELIIDLTASQGYSIGALKQEGNMILLVADTVDDMARIRQAILGSSFAEGFLKEGGLVVELIADETGLFKRHIVLRNLENPLAFLTLSAEELTLVENGAEKIVGAIRISEVDGETILVRVKSAVDGRIYDLNIPANSAYSNLSAEVLEKAGLPAIEAFLYEEFLTKFGGFLGKVGFAAGILWMAYDGFKWGTDLMGLGKTVQLKSRGIPPTIGANVGKAISKLGLDSTSAYATYEDAPMADVAERLADRIMVGKGSYYLKLDNPGILGIPFIASDDEYDCATSIEVIPDYHSGIDGKPIIDKITYKNTINNEEIVFLRGEDGIFLQESGPVSLKFQSVVNKPNSDQVFLVPFELNFAEQGKVIISPDWP